MVVLASLCNDVGYNGKTIKEPHTKEASTMDYTTFVGAGHARPEPDPVIAAILKA